MRKQKKRRNHKRKEIIHKKSLCFLLILIMVLSLQPQNLMYATSLSQEDITQNQEETKEEVGTLRESQDFTEKLDFMKLRANRMIYQQTEEVQHSIDVTKEVLDLSGIDVQTLLQPQLEFTLFAPALTTVSDIRAKDTFTFDVASSLFYELKTEEPVAVYAYDKAAYDEDHTMGKTEEQVAEYTIDEHHKVTLTFIKDITVEEHSSLFMVFALPMQFDQNETKDMIQMVLQSDEVQTIGLTIKLPELKEENKEEPDTEVDVKEPIEEDTTSEEPIENTDTVKEKESLEEEQVKEPLHLQTFTAGAAANMFQLLKASNPYRQIITTNLPEGFASVKISIANQNGGYLISSTNKEVGFQFEIVLDDDVLYMELERVLAEFPDAPIYSNDEQYEKDILEFLQKEEVANSLHPLTYTFSLGDNFSDYDGAAAPFLDGTGSEIGKYWIEDGVVHASFLSTMYYYSGVHASFNFKAVLDSDAELTENPKEAQFENGSIVLKEIGSISGGDDPATAPAYSIDKDGPLQVNKPEIKYTIHLTTKKEEASLVNQWLIDKIPSGMKVHSFAYVDTEKERHEITDYKVENHELRYQLMQESMAKEASFELVLELDDVDYQNVIKSGGINKRFSNEAYVKEQETGEPLVTSETVNTGMKFNFLKKEGQQQDLEGTKFRWSISADTKLPMMEYGYLVDTFSWTDHMLVKDSSITIRYEGGTDVFPVNTLEKINAVIPYGELTAEKIKDLAGTRTKPFYYLYDTDIDHPFGDGVSQQCVLIVPFDQYRGITSSQEMTMQYLTELNLHGMSIDEYLTHHAADQRQIGNIVNLLWKNKGEGPGPATWDESVNFKKDVDTNIDIMTKKGISYDPGTQTAIWNLEINKMGANLSAYEGDKGLEVTDVFAKGAYDLDAFQITYTEYDRNKEVGKGTLEKNKDYTILDGAENTKHLSFFVPALSKDQYRIYRIETKVTDPTLLSKQGLGSMGNEAVIKASIDGTPVERTSKAALNIPNTLIEKEAVGSYDYLQHLFTWKVTVNPNKLDITDAVVIDTLEEHTSFDRILSVTDEHGNEVQGSYQGVSTANPHEIKFDLGDIRKRTLVLTFTTHLDQRDILGGLKEATRAFPNNVELTGIVHGSEATTAQITDASAAASNVVKNNQMVKGGVYDKNNGTIDWTIYLNKDQVNLKDMVFVEDLTDAATKLSIQDLKEDSIKIYQMEMNADGSVNETSQQEIDPGNRLVIHGFDKFSLDISAGRDDNHTYKITFTTYLNEYAANAKIQNIVYLKDNADQEKEDSNVSDGGYDGSFDFEDMAAKNPRPKVGIKKISSNSSEENLVEGNNHFLSKAEFQLQAYEIMDQTTDTWVLGNEYGAYKKINMSSNGNLYFLNLVTKDTLIYELKETKAPLGYQLDEESTYIYFSSHPESFAGKTITVNGKEVNIIPFGTNVALKQLLIHNTPTPEATFHFIKQIPAEMNTDGTVKSYQNAKAEFTFLLQATGDLKGKVKDREVKTDINGNAKFENLDPGTYTLTEVHSDTNLNVGGSFTLQVNVKETDGYSFELKGNPNKGLSYELQKDQTYVLKNDYVRGDLTFTKKVLYQDGTTDQILLNNQEPLGNVEFTLTAAAGSTTNAGYEVSEKSNANGKVTFSGLPVGSYILKESKIDGYHENTNTYQVTVVEQDDTLLYDQYKNKKAVVTMKKTSENNVITTIENTPLKAKLKFNKTVNQNATGLTGMDQEPLVGVEFGLFRKIGNDTAKEALYKATSADDGSITFDNIEYGDYVLKELHTPAGFEPMKDLSISRTSFVKEDGYIYDLNQVENKILNQNVGFKKIDQDENPITDVEFSVYRRGSASITADTKDAQLLLPDPSVTTYYPYRNQTKTSDAEGKFALQNLPYGDYLLIETKAPDDLQEGHNKEAIHITINQTGIVVKEHENFDGVLEHGAYEIATLDTWETLSATNDIYSIVNQKKYGYVQLHKVTGESWNNQLTQTNYSHPLANVTFQIDLCSDSANPIPYLQITTNEQGNFTIETDGSYKGVDPSTNKEVTKHLYYNNYRITELSTQNGFQPDAAPVEFQLSETSIGHKGTAWISNHHETKVRYQKATEGIPSSTAFAFVNEIVRGSMRLSKTGLDGIALNDAVFEVTAGSTAVASIRYMNGAYVLSNQKAQGTGTYAETKGNIPYLFEDNGSYRLLHGTYTVEEVHTPAGYHSASFTMSIDEVTGQVSYSNVKNGTISNNVIQDLPLQLNIDKQNASGISLKNAEFMLLGTFADGTLEKPMTEANKAVLIAGNTYQIKETKAPYGYVVSEKLPEITISNKGMVSIIKSEDVIELKNNTIIFKNEPIRIDLTKVDEHDKTIDGAGFTLSGRFADASGNLQTAATKIDLTTANGRLSLFQDTWNLASGQTYTLQETKAPDGYILSKDPVMFSVGEDGRIKDLKGNEFVTSQDDALGLIVKNHPIQIELTKQDATDQTLLDAVFCLKDTQTTVTINDIKTKEGKLQLGKPHLIQGHTYQLFETQVPVGYEVPSQAVVEFSVNEDGTIDIKDGQTGVGNININNIRKTGSIELTKLDAKDNTKLKGAQFILTNGKETFTKITDENGALRFDGLVWGTYTLKETKAPDGYKLDPTEHSITIDAQNLSVSFLNGTSITNEKNRFTIIKEDMQGNPLDGAVFEIKDLTDPALSTGIQAALSSLTGNRIELTGILIAGHTYELSETKAPLGYQRERSSVQFEMQKDGTITTAGSWTENYQQTSDRQGVLLKNKPVTVTIVKQDQNKKPQAGVVFEVKPENGTFFDQSKDVKAFMTNEQGEIQLTGELMYGTKYIIHEKQALAGYTYLKDQVLIVDEDGRAILQGETEEKERFVLTDTPIQIDIVKQDEEDKVIEGIEFTLKQTNTSNQWSLISDVSGKLMDKDTGKALSKILYAQAEYSLREDAKADSPYVNLNDIITFSINREGKIENLKHSSKDKVTLSDDALHMIIINEKTRVSFLKHDEQGKVLKGATLALYPDNKGTAGTEIVKMNGTELRWTSSDTAHEITMLPQGSYWLKEIETPYGYVTAAPIQFTLNEAGKIVINGTQQETQQIIMVDEAVAGQFRITKKDTEGRGIENVSFDLYKADGTMIAKNLVTNERGIWNSEESEIERMDQTNQKLKAGLEAGTYDLMETATPDQYQLPQGDQAKTTFTIAGKENDQIIVQPVVMNLKITNETYKRTLSIKKVDEEDQTPIQGVRFALQRINDASGAKVEEQAMEASTDQDGKLEFLVRKKGTYRLQEIETVKGYVLGETPYETEFTIHDTSEAQITLAKGNIITNQRDTGTMTLKKSDDASKEALNDTVFTLEHGDQVVGSFETGYRYHNENDSWIRERTEDGTLIIEDLVWGDYVIKETKASDGYQLQNNTRSFTIGKAGMDMILEVNDIGFTNLKTVFSFQKSATYVEHCSDPSLGEDVLPAGSTRVLSQAEFTAYDAQGNVFATALSDERGIVTFHKMLSGQTYTIKETKTPDGFVENTKIYQVSIDEQGQSGALIDTATVKPVKEIINEIQTTDIVLKKVSEQNPDKMISDSVYGLYRISKARIFAQEPQLIATAKTDAQGMLRFSGVLMNQTYMIKELEAPQGSHRSEHPITISFAMKDGKAVITEFDDGEGTAAIDEQGNIVWYEPDIMVSFTKTDTDGTPLAGAAFMLLDEEGTVVDTWISTKEAYLTTNLLTAGKTYTLREDQAPYGYALADDIEFTVIEKNMGPGLNYVEEITMINELNRIIVEKRDKDSNALIKGAHFVIMDEEGKISKDASGKEFSWISNGEDTLEGIAAGTYILKELQAPENYQLADDITFTIDVHGNLYVNGAQQERLVMKDEIRPVDGSYDKDKVDSGDHTDIQVYFMLLGISILSLAVLLKKFFQLRKG